jgi:hypothetical protein
MTPKQKQKSRDQFMLALGRTTHSLLVHQIELLRESSLNISLDTLHKMAVEMQTATDLFEDVFIDGTKA